MKGNKMQTKAQKLQDLKRKQTSISNPVLVDEPLDKFIIRRPVHSRLSSEETRSRMEAFTSEREEVFVAAIREDESRDLST